MIVIQRRSRAAPSTTAFPVASASAGAGKVIYEQAGWIHLFDPGEGKSRRLKIGVAADLLETRPRYATGAKHVRNTDLSPSGKRAVLEYRGEIVTVPAKKGDPRNLTQTPGAHERSPVWSPDGKSIAYFSDASGEYVLVVRPQDGKGDGRVLSPQRGRLLRSAGLVARQQEDRLYRQRSRPLLDRPRHRRRQADRRRADLQPDQYVELMAGPPTRNGWPTPSPTGPAFKQSSFMRSGPDQSHAADRRPHRGRRAGLRLQRQVPLLPGLDRRWTGQELVRPVQYRHAGDIFDLPGHACEGDAQPALEGER